MLQWQSIPTGSGSEQPEARVYWLLNHGLHVLFRHLGHLSRRTLAHALLACRGFAPSSASSMSTLLAARLHLQVERVLALARPLLGLVLLVLLTLAPAKQISMLHDKTSGKSCSTKCGKKRS